MNDTTFIYGLFDPRDCRLRYIGKSNNPQKRLKQHILSAISNPKSHKDNWIRSLLAEDLEPSVEILEEVPIDNWEEAERAWISDCKKFNLKLVNGTDGGDTSASFTPEARANMSIARMGMKFSIEHKENMKKSWIRRKEQYGNGFTNDGLNKIRTKNKKWREENPEIAENQRKALVGKHRSEETKDKLRVANLGKKVSEETRAKMRIANKGRIPPMKGKKWSPEMIEVFRQKSLGRPQSEEQRRKKSESLKAFYARKKLEESDNASDS